jgi:outer membrane protein TolC
VTFEIQEDALRKQFASLDQSKATIEGQIAYYNSLAEYYRNLDAVTHAQLIATYESLASTLQTQLNNLPSSSENQEDKEDALESFDEMRDLNMSQVRISAEMSRDGQVYMAQKYFMAYKSLEDQLADMKSQYEYLKKQFDALKLQRDLGLATDANVSSFEISFKNADAGIDTLKKSLEDLESDINILFGQEYDNRLELGDLPSVDNAKINAMDYEQDYETAEDNNYNIRLKLIDYQLKDDSYDNASGDEEDKAEYDRDSAKLQLEEQNRKFALTFDKAFRAVKDAEAALDNERYDLISKRTEWTHAQLKYTLGLISKNDWQNAKLTYDSASHKYDNAQQDVFDAYLKYEWLLNGMELGSDSGTGATVNS